MPSTLANSALGFTALPLPFYGLVVTMVGLYPAVAEVTKRWFFRRYFV